MKTKIKWYKVSDILPDYNKVVLVRRSKRGFQISNFDVASYDRFGFNLHSVTHWAELPDDSDFGELEEEEIGV